MVVLEYVIPLSWGMILSAVLTFIGLSTGITAKYGRYTQHSNTQSSVPATFAWFFKESPSFFLPLCFLQYSDSNYGIVLNLMMLAHYFNRTFVFPLRMKSENELPLHIVMSSFVFSTWNGFIQGAWNSKFQPTFDESPTYSLALLCVGILVFLTGMIINQSSDEVLFNLRRPGETGYKIPRGKLFNYVSCANYFGEIIEWIGYAIAAQSLPAVAFALLTFCNLVPRAASHHKWYKYNLKTYPKNRKALIPFIW